MIPAQNLRGSWSCHWDLPLSKPVRQLNSCPRLTRNAVGRRPSFLSTWAFNVLPCDKQLTYPSTRPPGNWCAESLSLQNYSQSFLPFFFSYSLEVTKSSQYKEEGVSSPNRRMCQSISDHILNHQSDQDLNASPTPTYVGVEMKDVL